MMLHTQLVTGGYRVDMQAVQSAGMEAAMATVRTLMMVKLTMGFVTIGASGSNSDSETDDDD